jgi:methionine synthase II (cobalamin-independent)
MVRIASGPDQWREAVRIQFAKGADLIKLASEYTQEEITAAVDEAHSLGLAVTVDTETQYIDMAIRPASIRSNIRCRAVTKPSR